MNALDGNGWLEKLELVAEKLGPKGPPVRLCLVGSAACLLEAMPGRASRDLDVWQPASDFDLLELKRVVVAAGLLFDPREVLEPDQPYLQLVKPGPSQTGDFTPVLWGRMGRLEVYLPPWVNLIASKLVRGDAKDIEDVLFLVGKYRIEVSGVRRCIDGFPAPAREQALENLVYLEMLES